MLMSKFNSIMQNKWFAIILIISATFIVYSNTFKNEFVYDDIYIIQNNEFIRDFRNIPKIFTKEYFQLAREKTYRPVCTASFFIDYKLWKLNVVGWHFTNIFLHALNGVLIFLLARKLLKHNLIALLSSIIFIVHPIQTEAINCISFREDIISFNFFLMGILLFISYRGNKIFYLYHFSCASFFIAVFTKEMALTLPGILLLYIWCFTDTKHEKPYYLSGYIIVIVFVFLNRYLFLKPSGLLFGLDVSSPTQYPGGNIVTALMTTSKVLVYYLKLLIMPSNLCLDYGNYLLTLKFDIKVLISLLIIMAIVTSAVKLFKRDSNVTFCILYIFVSLIPVYNIVPIGATIAERYLYFPSFGFSMLIGIVVYKIYKNKKNKVFSIILAGIIIVFFANKTISRNLDWMNSITLWQSVINCRPNNPKAFNNLGVGYFNRGNFEEAVNATRKAIQLSPSYAEAYNNLGNAYYKLNRFAEAYYAFGDMYRINKNYNNAIESYEKAIKENPVYLDAYNNLGNIYMAAKNYDLAIEAFKKTVEIDSLFIKGYSNLGVAYGEKGNYLNSVASFEKTLKINPLYLNVYMNLANTYLKNREYDKAINSYKKAFEIADKEPLRNIIKNKISNIENMKRKVYNKNNMGINDEYRYY